MKWEKLKELIQDEIADKPESESALELKKAAADMGVNLQNYLRRYDVRSVPALRERFRHLFPKYLRTCMLYVNKDRQGNWTIDDKVK